MCPLVSPFHLALASEDEDQDSLDQAGGSVWAAADPAEDLPALELGVGPLARSTLAGVSGVHGLLVADTAEDALAHGDLPLDVLPTTDRWDTDCLVDAPEREPLSTVIEAE
jgi:hypothetical protein